MASNILPLVIMAGTAAFLLTKKKSTSSSSNGSDIESPPPPPPDFEDLDGTMGDAFLTDSDVEGKCTHFIDLIYSEITAAEAADGALPIEDLVVTETIIPKVKADIGKHIVSNSALESVVENFGLAIMNDLILGCAFTYQKLATDPSASVLRYLTSGKIAPFKANEIFHGILEIIGDVAAETYPGFTVVEDPPPPAFESGTKSGILPAQQVTLEAQVKP